MSEERLKLAVFIDFDNIEIGVKETLGKEFDVALALEALKERGEVVTKVAYGDWHRAGEQSRQMTQHAVQMVQRNVTPRGDKNGADINLALDALEMAFNRPHINAFAIVGGDSDFIALVEKLKQYDKRIIVVGGRAFTSNILQRNCHEFVAYENLLQSAAGGDGPRRSSRRGEPVARSGARPLSDALRNLQRALKVLAEREVAPQLGLLKSTLLQLDSTFSERDYGAGSFLDFMQKVERAGLVHLRKVDRGYLAELVAGEDGNATEAQKASNGSERVSEPTPLSDPPANLDVSGAMTLLKQALAAAHAKSPNRPLYMRQVRQALRALDKEFDERRYGFRGFLDLLHQAQRESSLHLQRDRKGVWRIFPSSPAAAPASVPIMEPEPEASTVTMENEALAAEPITEAIPEPEAFTSAQIEPADSGPALVDEASRSSPSPTRRPRARRSARIGQRKTSSRRKTKEPESDEH